MTLKDTIRFARKNAGLTQAELATKTGVSQQAIQKYENGTITNIASDKIELIAKACNCTPAYLMGWEETKRENDRLAAVAVRLKKDEVFQKLVLSINDLPIEKIIALQAVVDALN